MFNPKGYPLCSLTPQNYKGPTMVLLAGGTLLVGDVVYFTTAGTVNKSTTSADYAAFAGVVVGGTATNMQFTADDASVVGTTAATVGQQVLVQYGGIATVQSAAA